mmetsp:Transcript_6374/g.18275  ORF Transcript_6374/g.18275 Transcript_6374/m.18275 type:complete len:327 (-) Transcript_6374:316-1296(-)
MAREWITADGPLSDGVLHMYPRVASASSRTTTAGPGCLVVGIPPCGSSAPPLAPAPFACPVFAISRSTHVRWMSAAESRCRSGEPHLSAGSPSDSSDSTSCVAKAVLRPAAGPKGDPPEKETPRLMAADIRFSSRALTRSPSRLYELVPKMERSLLSRKLETGLRGDSTGAPRAAPPRVRREAESGPPPPPPPPSPPKKRCATPSTQYSGRISERGMLYRSRCQAVAKSAWMAWARNQPTTRTAGREMYHGIRASTITSSAGSIVTSARMYIFLTSSMRSSRTDSAFCMSASVEPYSCATSAELMRLLDVYSTQMDAPSEVTAARM